MKKIIKYLLLFILLFNTLLIISCKNKYELTENAYTIKYKDSRSNSVTFNGELYYLYQGRVLLASKEGNSKVTLVNIYYDDGGNVTRVENTKTIILNKDKTYPVSFIVTKQNTTKNGSIVEYLSMRQAIYVYEGYDIVVDTSYN